MSHIHDPDRIRTAREGPSGAFARDPAAEKGLKRPMNEAAAALPSEAPSLSYRSIQSMKIAYLVNQYPQVSHSFVRREIAGLEACGHTIERISIRPCRETLKDEADVAELGRTRSLLKAGGGALIGAAVWSVVMRPVRFSRALRQAVRLDRRSDRGLLRHMVYLLEACLLRRWMDAADVDRVHAHFGTNSTAVAMLCRALGGPPYSFTVHGPEEFDKPHSLSLSEKIEHADFVVAISSFGRSQLSRWRPFSDWGRIHEVHCGVDETFLRAEPTPVPDSRRLVCVGRLCEQKAQGLLVQAAARLIHGGDPFELTLVGDGPMREEIEALIAQEEIGEHVRITGWMSGSEVREEIEQARALVLPSFAEGLPVVIMEALALGRPVVSTYVAGIPELVEPGVCGYLTPAGSVDALVEAMRSVLAEPTEALTKMGEQGRRRVSERHNAATEAARLAAIFAHASEHRDDSEPGRAT